MVLLALGIPPAQAEPSRTPSARAELTSSQATKGRPLYVTNSLSDNVAGFTVGADGSPVPNGAPTPTQAQGSAPSAIVTAPDGRAVYVVERNAGVVQPYRVGADGTLSPLSDPVLTGGRTPFGTAIAPDGRTLYTANLGSGTVSVFAINADGTLTLRGDPVPATDNPRGLAVTPDGRFLYVGHGVPLTDLTNTLDRFAIGPDGTLSGRSTVATTGGAGTGMGTTPDGQYLYVAATTTDQLFGFRVRKDGALTATPGSPYSVADHPEGVAVSPDGRHLFLASPSQVRPDTVHAVSAFTIGTDGSLRAVPGSPFEAGAGPVGIAVTPDGRFLYVSHFDGNELYSFAIGSTGALTRTPGSPVSSGGQAPAFEALTIIPDQGPTAVLSTPAKRNRAGQAADLYASASTDPDGGKIARYDWDFGDGTVLRDAGLAVQHVYTAPGSYTAQVTVTDDEGCSTTRVFTGQTLLCNGSNAATDTVTVTVN
ncbi:beta-propeller fold lactonase family protein [Streptomyces olivaceoviridis]|uniref:beta-propeller fold lactonase family protein n=1 Tax=Streptomyces olivaceoviridis TaxID=1921 RepID=UPI0037025051